MLGSTGQRSDGTFQENVNFSLRQSPHVLALLLLAQNKNLSSVRTGTAVGFRRGTATRYCQIPAADSQIVSTRPRINIIAAAIIIIIILIIALSVFRLGLQQ